MARDQDWFDEVDLDPEGHWRRMGTRNLGGQPWLIIDGLRDRELALKQALSAERHDDVFAIEPGADGHRAGVETLDLVTAALAEEGLDPVGDAHDLHPLDRAGRSVQEDLCLLRRDGSGWILAGGSLCFPSRWRLTEKMGLPLGAVHGPVEGYRDRLSGRVDSLLDRLGDRVVRRRNWFIHPDGALHQPDRPVGGDPIVPAERCGEELYLRSERQTLRSLPASGWILFTIRIQHCPLETFWRDEDRRARLRRFLEAAPPEVVAHHGLAPGQVDSVIKALDRIQA